MADIVDLRQLFMNLQTQMIARLDVDAAAVAHPTVKGNAYENNWRAMLSDYLPRRYQVEDGFLVDADGSISQQIDVVVFDRQYSPFLFKQDGCTYMPAESAYAVFEVKPTLGAKNIEYAGEKIASARKLRRTSTTITHAGGKFEPRPPPPIIGGILTSDAIWTSAMGDSLKTALRNLVPQAQLDLGCVLKRGGFEVEYERGALKSVMASGQNSGLMFFFLHFLARLQTFGTAPAIDFREYAKGL